MTSTNIAGLLLAAGLGRRMGTPKALLHDASGVPFLHQAIVALLDGGCRSVTVVLGASSETAVDLLASLGWGDSPQVSVVVADDYAHGIGASLHAGLSSLADADAALVMLVDLPDVGDDVIRRLAGHAGPEALARATYDARPGHPVLIGRSHWAGVLATLHGDVGARGYLDSHGVDDVPCDDLASGKDVDRPEDLEGESIDN